MLNEIELALKLHDALGQKTDGQGAPTTVSSATQAYASGVVDSLKAAIINNPPGTITGITAPGSPLAAGAGLGGIITIQPSPMIAKTSNGFIPPGPDLIKENTAVIQYIGTGIIVFPAGTITGTCTNTPVSAGPLLGGAGAGGQITAITGAGCLAAVIAAGVSIGPDALKHYTTLIDYVLANAEASYASGTVTGTCPAGGGPLTLGTGLAGSIT